MFICLTKNLRLLKPFLIIFALMHSFPYAQGLYSSPQSPSSPSFTTNSTANSSVDQSVKIEIAQRLLSRLGYLKDTPTGVMSSATAEAIRAFSYEHNINSGSSVTEPLLKALRNVAWNSGAWKKGNLKGEDKLLDANGIREAQSYLVKLGFDPGPIDGTFGAQTQSSVESFQANQRTSIDGMITKTTLMNLKRSSILQPGQILGTVRVLNWPDYIEPSVLEDFERETKIRVIYDTYGSNEEMEAKLKSNPEPYDVAIPTASNISALVSQKLLKPLDKSKLKNLANVDPKILAYLEAWDPGTKYSIPYMWFTLGIATNPKLVAKYLPGVNLESLGIVFDPSVASKLSACGVRVIDSPSDVIPLAALYGGVKKWNNDTPSLEASEKILMGIKKYVKPISSDEYISALAQGKICAAIGFSGDTLQAKASQSGGNVVQYRVPVEGGSLGFDTLTTPTNSKNVDAAHKFIDYILRPKVIGKISNTVRYANGNINSGPYIEPSLLSDQGIFPPQDVMRRLIVVPSLTSKTKQDMEKLWKQFQ
ncbi:extracellular solute-binding protein [Polynucleobacter rarus]|uniref:extracellular solute-binding protein n=1 Tax=Polynucleobacter rarus TaxID=556055 RepID=UPI000D3E8E10|nr:extracellular solute-binding protein [Polynucleobacter rarus]